MKEFLGFVIVAVLVGGVVTAITNIPYALGFVVRWWVDGYRQGRGR